MIFALYKAFIISPCWRINNTFGEVIGEVVNRQNMHTCDDICDDICDDVYDVNAYFCYIMLLYLKHI